jgi:hypothetical protein
MPMWLNAMLGAWDMALPLPEFANATHERISRGNIFVVFRTQFCYCNAANLIG